MTTHISKMKLKKVYILIFMAVVLMVSGCLEDSDDSSEMDARTSATLERYRENEIQDYKGANLDPAIGPRDNSIKGVQYVDIDSYKLSVTGLVNRPVELDYSDVLELDDYQRLITLYCVEGWDATTCRDGISLYGGS